MSLSPAEIQAGNNLSTITRRSATLAFAGLVIKSEMRIESLSQR